MADNDTINGTTKTIFNDPDKLARTKQNLADDFATGPDYGEKLKGMLGLSDEPKPDTSEQRRQLARQMVYRRR